VDKPAGWTSQDVVSWVRKRFRIKKVGHTGTLDPMATGVMVLCLGAYTRLSSFVTNCDKKYRAVVRLGACTDTLDAEGVVLARCSHVPDNREDIAPVVSGFEGVIEQMPPMHSAIRVGGRRLYELARKGVDVERPVRQVQINRIVITCYQPPLLHLDVHCSKGTYIRSLADDIGRKLGCGGYLCTLRRTVVGSVHLSTCTTLNALREIDDTAKISVIDAQTVLSDLPLLRLTASQRLRFSNGNFVAEISPKIPDDTLVNVQDLQGSMLGIGQMVDGFLKPLRVFSQSR